MVVAINPNVNKRDTAWVAVCTDCQCERTVTYAQAWNISKGNTRSTCRDCSIRLGKYVLNLSGLEKGRVHHPKKAKNSAPWTAYRNLFLPVSSETKAKQSAAKKGKTGPLASRWEGGKSAERRRIMSTGEYQRFRRSMLKSFDNKCTECGSTQSLHLHHIKSWSKFPELRMCPQNVTALCRPCHMELHHG